MVKRFFASGFWLMVLAAFIYSIGDTVLKVLSSSLPTTEIVFIRFLLGALLLWPILSSRRISFKGNHLRFLILRGLLGTISFFCLLKSMAMIPLSITMVLFYTFPLFTALFSFFLLGETVGKGELGLIVVGLLGIYILINPGAHPFDLGYLFGLLASCLGGMCMVIIRKARETNGPLIIYFYFCLVGGGFSLPLFVLNFKMPDFQQWILLLTMGLTLLVAQVLMNHGFKFCKAAEGSLFLMSELVFAGIAGILLFKDPVTLHFLAGTILIVGSGLGLNLMKRRPRPFQGSLDS